jgi:hypothetical protein
MSQRLNQPFTAKQIVDSYLALPAKDKLRLIRSISAKKRTSRQSVARKASKRSA